MFPALPFTPFIPSHLRSLSTMGLYGTVPMSATLPSSGNWQTANYIIYAPVYLPLVANLKQLWWVNGASVVSTNVNMGVYDQHGNRLAQTGSTAQAGTSDLQVVDIVSHINIQPGILYLALQFSTTGTTTFLRLSGAAAYVARAAGLYGEQAGSFTLPPVATFAAATDSSLPLMGMDFMGVA